MSLITPAKLNAIKALVTQGGKFNKEALDAIKALGSKPGKGNAPVAPAPVAKKKETVIGKPVKKTVPVKAVAPAPKSKKVAPAPVVVAKATNFSAENNYDVRGEQIEPKTLKKIRALLNTIGMEVNGYFLLCPDGSGARMIDNDGKGSVALVYRGPVKADEGIYPHNHRTPK